jgi:hypothetical protein
LGPVPDLLLDAFSDAFWVRQRATLAEWRSVLTALAACPARDREFLADELALRMGVHPATAAGLVASCSLAADLPALLGSWEAEELTDRHVHTALDELHSSCADDAIRTAVLDRVLTRCRERAALGHGWPRPGQLRRMIRAAALVHDLDAARKRRERKAAERSVFSSGLADGQGYLTLTGPAEQVAAMHAAIEAAGAALGADPTDGRTRAQREFDAAYSLLTSGALSDAEPGLGEQVRLEVQIVVPIDTADGTGQALGELPGHGPLHPDTCRDLVSSADRLRRICIDAVTGRVLAVDDPVTVSRDALQIDEALQRMRTDPLVIRDLRTDAYRPTRRALMFVRTRDRTCRFPGCTRPATGTDLDHALPWPTGPTLVENLHCLCRHHHRAKQSALFTVTRDPDGSTVWTTRSGRSYRSPPEPLTPSG